MIFKSDETFRAYERAVAEVPALLIHLRCEADVRRQREADRGDREVGLAESTAAVEWIPNAPDLVIDTTHMDVDSATALIADRLQ